ncbi:MAG: plasmid stabilization system [Gammaproteobacteria bacterium]|jgi:plasmid stabilization system protein ParE|nr:plasmid stabilization system [Gammaproteobacteria bacterium]
MMGIVWLNSAVEDIVRLREFIAKENRTAAQKAAEAIKIAVQRLIETPLMGKPVQNLPSFRDLLTRFGGGGYVLRYRIEAETIYIVHVRHYREADFV